MAMEQDRSGHDPVEGQSTLLRFREIPFDPEGGEQTACWVHRIRRIAPPVE